MNDNVLICLIRQGRPQPAGLRACRLNSAAGNRGSPTDDRPYQVIMLGPADTADQEETLTDHGGCSGLHSE
jgi:hypothetical protein